VYVVLVELGLGLGGIMNGHAGGLGFFLNNVERVSKMSLFLFERTACDTLGMETCQGTGKGK
jgi:hypothetical protein